ncbi:MAG TPA: outer membrane protein transport protein [Kofleriaceae bacterium]|nr:outer membrane protein transport protein [Kofleriaceae bacterium]
MKKIALALLLASAPSAALAGGLYVPGYGSQGQPRAGAFVAKADDGSALYYNPAGLAKQRGTSIHLGFNFIDFDQKFQRAGVYEDWDPGNGGTPPDYIGEPFAAQEDNATPAVGFGGFQGIPTFAVVSDLGGKSPVVLAIGLIAEHGFPEREYGEAYLADGSFSDPSVAPPPGRYDILEQDVSAAFPSIGAGYSIMDKLDVGLRVSWGFAGTKGTTQLWGIRNYEEDVRSEGLFAVDAHDYFIPAAAAGVLYRPHANIEVGAQYVTEKTANFKGDAQAILGSNLAIGPDTPDFIEPILDQPACEGGGTITKLKTCVDLTLPQTATVGARYVFRDPDGAERGDVEFDVQWEDWSAASDVKVVVDGKSGLTGLELNPTLIRHGFEDTYSFRLGGAYGFDVGKNQLIARAGAAYDTAAAPLSWTRLDIDGMARTTLGAGLAYQMAKIRFELGGGVVLESTREVDLCNPDEDNLGCEESGVETPAADRDRPDPAQPLLGNPVESPFNAGRYEQGYVLLSAGATYQF